jgi:serine/threonine protein kinase
LQHLASADPTPVAAICRLQASGNAVELLGTFEDRSCVYIVMEECRGGDLETLLEVRLVVFCVSLCPYHTLSFAL